VAPADNPPAVETVAHVQTPADNPPAVETVAHVQTPADLPPVRPGHTELDSKIAETSSIIQRESSELKERLEFAQHSFHIIRDTQYKYNEALEQISHKQNSLKELHDVLLKLRRAKAHEELDAKMQETKEKLEKLSASQANAPLDRLGYGVVEGRFGWMLSGLQTLTDRNHIQVAADADRAIRQATAFDARALPKSNDAMHGLALVEASTSQGASAIPEGVADIVHQQDVKSQKKYKAQLKLKARLQAIQIPTSRN